MGKKIFCFSIIFFSLFMLSNVSLIAQQTAERYNANNSYVPLEWYAFDAANSTFDKEINISFNDTPFEKALAKIARKAEVRLMYKKETLPAHRINLSFNNATIIECFKRILADTDLEIMASPTGQLVIKKRKPIIADKLETGVIKGTVTNAETGEPMPGASVYCEGTTIGDATDKEGEYEITGVEPGEYVLVAQFIGYKSEKKKITIEANDTLSVNFKLTAKTGEMSELVVTGFYKKSTESFTGSVQTITSEELKGFTATNVIEAIAALTPGMVKVEDRRVGSDPNHVPQLILRGMSSFPEGTESVNQPLIILDGVEISMEDLYDLNINQIKSINVLKDASASALYGARAASGVIVIERKRVAEGNIKVSYDFSETVGIPDLSSYDYLNAADKLEFERLAGLYDSPIGEYDSLYNARYQAVRRGVNTDWMAQPARNSLSQNHSLRAYGGSGNINYEVNLRYNNTHGVMKGDYRKRYGIGFFLSYHLSDKLTVSNRFDLNQVDSKLSPYGSFSNYTEMNPYDRIYNGDGSLNTDLSWENINPLYEAQIGNYDKSKSKNITNSTHLRWLISDNFKLTSQLNYSSDQKSSLNFLSPNSRVFKDVEDPNMKGRLILGNTDGSELSGKMVFSYNRLSSNNSLLNINIGGDIGSNNSNFSQSTGVGFMSNRLDHIGLAANYIEGRPVGNEDISKRLGAFINGSYMYNNRYLIDVIYQRSGSSKFGKDNRFGTFWSGGLGWNIHNESFMNIDNLDILKLKATVGYTGKVSFSPYQAMTTYQYLSELEYLHGIGAIPITIGDPDLAWERTLNYNLGLDASFFGRRLNLAFNVYLKQTKDLLIDQSLAPSTGFNTKKENLGEIENRGYEISIGGFLIYKNDFRWQIKFNGFHNQSKILKISNALKFKNEAEERDGIETPLPQYEEGQSLTAIKAVRSAGIDPATGKEVYITLDGERTFDYNPDDRVVVGDTEPDIRGRISTSLFYKGFSVLASFKYTYGGYIYNTTRARIIEAADPHLNADQRVFDNRWKKPGDVALYSDIAGSVMPKQTDRFVEKNNVFSLNTLNFAYEVDKNWVNNIGLNRLRLGLNFSNVFRLSPVKIERGTDYLFNRTVTFTLSTTF